MRETLTAHRMSHTAASVVNECCLFTATPTSDFLWRQSTIWQPGWAARANDSATYKETQRLSMESAFFSVYFSLAPRFFGSTDMSLGWLSLQLWKSVVLARASTYSNSSSGVSDTDLQWCLRRTIQNSWWQPAQCVTTWSGTHSVTRDSFSSTCSQLKSDAAALATPADAGSLLSLDACHSKYFCVNTYTHRVS